MLGLHRHSGERLTYATSLHDAAPSATQAIEDGIVLAQELKAGDFRDVEGALTSYHQKRSERTQKIVNMAWWV